MSSDMSIPGVPSSSGVTMSGDTLVVSIYGKRTFQETILVHIPVSSARMDKMLESPDPEGFTDALLGEHTWHVWEQRMSAADLESDGLGRARFSKRIRDFLCDLLAEAPIYRTGEGRGRSQAFRMACLFKEFLHDSVDDISGIENLSSIKFDGWNILHVDDPSYGFRICVFEDSSAVKVRPYHGREVCETAWLGCPSPMDFVDEWVSLCEDSEGSDVHREPRDERVVTDRDRFTGFLTHHYGEEFVATMKHASHLLT